MSVLATWPSRISIPPIDQISYVIVLSRYPPIATGHGGNHRSYQIYTELTTIFGLDSVCLLNLDSWTNQRPPGARYHSVSNNPFLRTFEKVRRRTIRYEHNPLGLLTGHSLSIYGSLNPDFVREYQVMASGISTNALCILEHPYFGDILSVNEQYGICSVSCAQNLEAFSHNLDSMHGMLSLPPQRAMNAMSRLRMHAALSDFTSELDVYRRCAARFMISKVEVGVLSGFGLNTDYYPYRPVGEVRKQMWAIREARATCVPEPGLFVVLGSATYAPNAEAFAKLMKGMERTGLPPGVKLLVVGKGSEMFSKASDSIPGVECLGWVSQANLNSLLARATAVIVPQAYGFGALTRVPELACAGVPILVSKHATLGIEVPPGTTVVDEPWKAWLEAITDAGHTHLVGDPDAYLAWEAAQSSPWARFL